MQYISQGACGCLWHKQKYNLPHGEIWYFFFLTENKRFTELEFATGNDLETSEVPLSVLFCIIQKNAFFECKGTINIRYEQKQRNHI